MNGMKGYFRHQGRRNKIKMKEEPLLELLETYMNMVEKQDEIIGQLGKIVARQAEDLRLLKNDIEFSDKKLEKDKNIAKKGMEQYQEMKEKLEP